MAVPNTKALEDFRLKLYLWQRFRGPWYTAKEQWVDEHVVSELEDVLDAIFGPIDEGAAVKFEQEQKQEV